MKPKLIHLYFRSVDLETMIAFLRGYDNLEIISADPVKITIRETDAFVNVDINHLREKSLEEIYQDFTAFIEPGSPGFDPEPILASMPRFGNGVFTIETAIPMIVIKNMHPAKICLRDYYYNLFGNETIQTVIGFIESDLNATLASKKLYMHRNTLNYRLDHFIAISEIDVRTFAGAQAIYLLFKF